MLFNVRFAGMFWKFFIAVIMLPVLTSAEAPLSTLTCKVSRQADGFTYRLSRPPRSPECKTCWESKNKTVIALDSDFDEQRVRRLTNQTLTMKDCHRYLRYTSDCSKGWEEVACESKCLLPKDNLTTTVDSTLVCITESWCLTKLMFGLGVFLMVVVAVIITVALLCIRKWRRRESATRSVSYTPANWKTNMELEEMKGVTVKT